MDDQFMRWMRLIWHFIDTWNSLIDHLEGAHGLGGLMKWTMTHICSLMCGYFPSWVVHGLFAHVNEMTWILSTLGIIWRLYYLDLLPSIYHMDLLF